MYRALLSIFRIYWREYGGVKELVCSPFFHLSLLASLFYSLGWIEFSWREFVISSLPTILGFSLAAYAITFSLMGSALHRALSIAIDKRRGISLIGIVNSTFFHVLVFQIITLTYAIFSKGRLADQLISSLPLESDASDQIYNGIFQFADVFGFFLTTYSLMLLLSVGIAMFRLGRLNPERQSTTPAPVANDDDGPQSQSRDVTKTLRFRFISRLARMLRLYDPPQG